MRFFIAIVMFSAVCRADTLRATESPFAKLEVGTGMLWTEVFGETMDGDRIPRVGQPFAPEEKPALAINLKLAPKYSFTFEMKKARPPQQKNMEVSMVYPLTLTNISPKPIHFVLRDDGYPHVEGYVLEPGIPRAVPLFFPMCGRGTGHLEPGAKLDFLVSTRCARADSTGWFDMYVSQIETPRSVSQKIVSPTFSITGKEQAVTADFRVAHPPFFRLVLPNEWGWAKPKY